MPSYKILPPSLGVAKNASWSTRFCHICIHVTCLSDAISYLSSVTSDKNSKRCSSVLWSDPTLISSSPFVSQASKESTVSPLSGENDPNSLQVQKSDNPLKSSCHTNSVINMTFGYVFVNHQLAIRERRWRTLPVFDSLHAVGPWALAFSMGFLELIQ